MDSNLTVSIARVQPEDYPLLVEWWNQYGFPPVPREFLPAQGKMVSIDGKKIAAGFLYKTDSKIAWLEWVVADKKADKKAKSLALDVLVDSIVRVRKDQKYSVIFTTSKLPALTDRLKRFGFMETDVGMSHFIRRV